ncbi:MAG TPA: hypothetical protein VH142_12770 [Polyangiaceae bacterium]|nr:hypothetical protein [Polyangiaceae bacterium]
MRTHWAAACLLGAVACSSGEDGTVKGNLRGSTTEAGATKDDHTPGDADVASAGGRATQSDSGVATGGGGTGGEGPNGCGVGGALGYSLRIPEMRVSIDTSWVGIAGGSVSACLNDVCTDFGISSDTPSSSTVLLPSSSGLDPSARPYVTLYDDDTGALSVTVDWSLDGVPAESDVFSIRVENVEHQIVASDRELATYHVPQVCPCTGPCGSASLTELPSESDAGARDAGYDAFADQDF